MGIPSYLYPLLLLVAFFVVVLLVRGTRNLRRGADPRVGRAILAQIGLTLLIAGAVASIVAAIGYGVQAPELVYPYGARIARVLKLEERLPGRDLGRVMTAIAWGARGLCMLLGAVAMFLSRPREPSEDDDPGTEAPRTIERGSPHFWWTGAELGVVFAVLTTVSAKNPVERGDPFRWGREIVHFGGLCAGVAFLLAVLAATLPVILDALEGRSFSSFVGARHVRATKSGFLTVISVLSMAGVAVSSCALCSVTSIMGGFGHDLKRKILNNNAHIVVDVTRPGGFGGWEEKLAATREALERAGGGAATPVVAGEAMASSASNTAGALVRGIDPETIGQVIDLPQNLEVGKFDYFLSPEKLLDLGPDEIVGRAPTGEPYFHGPDFRNAPDTDPSLREFFKQTEKVYPGVIVGRELAKSLHVLVGDEVTLLSPMGKLGPMGVMPLSRKFRVAGIFYSGMYEYDATFAYIMLAEAQSFLGLDDGDRITQIDIRVPDPERAGEYAAPVRAAVESTPLVAGKGATIRVRDWMEMNKNLFSALLLEKIATFVILSLAILVASFCIVCTLLLMVTEKGKEIAILKALGASDGAIMRVFMLEGVIIGGIGTVFGVGTALATCTGLSWFGVRLDPEVYYIDRLPVNVSPGDYAMVAVAAMIICTISTIYPAYAASELRPVDGLRWE